MENLPKSSNLTLRERLLAEVERMNQRRHHQGQDRAKRQQAILEASRKAINDRLDRSFNETTVPGLGPATYAEDLRGMVNRSFCFSEKYSEQQGRADRVGAQPEMLEFERKMIKRAFKLGIPLFAHSVCRSGDDQNRLFVKGVTKARGGESPHNYGAAVDLIHGTKGWDLTRKQWGILGHIGKELAETIRVPYVAPDGKHGTKPLRLTWGGDWKFYDPAHWELTNWQEIRDQYR